MLQDAWFTVQAIDSHTYAISEYGHWEKVHSFLPITIITTHAHTDHIGSHGEFDTILVHPQDEAWLVHGITGLSIEQIRRDIGRDLTLTPPASFNPDSYTPYQGKPTGLLNDGQQLDLGARTLTIYHTPGHSPGHICVFDQPSGYLFTGDLLYDETPVYAFYPSTDPAALVQSLDRITRIAGVSRIFGSHNTLGLAPDILQEVTLAVSQLRERDLVRHGTGIHTFKGFSLQF
ncbi:MBL fold metallo-hydrolase [Paenibacillus donghaensis]|uniref:MBL fold metallo-hydrolase n=1 Tax=Paenibacillus donghaensis TaxID=414771 RepID=A0A2Z2KF44_9BACL|nr:MBL fold metallo-hydrolase [Paenibacillus donghaensis]ASA21780.1 MBL fold metallo-hydrolase [Paenibacillus donghaensis]